MQQVSNELKANPTTNPNRVSKEGAGWRGGAESRAGWDAVSGSWVGGAVTLLVCGQGAGPG